MMSKGRPLIEKSELEELVRISRGRSEDHEMDKRVIQALSIKNPDLSDLAALISPAASPYLEKMAQKAYQTTQRHFGKVIELYIPLYISNYCVNGCDYCGFASDRKVERKRLNLEEIKGEAKALADEGFDEVLLLTGERNTSDDFTYLREAVILCREFFNRVTVEAFPMETEEYAALVDAGLFGVTIYQETYDRELYRKVHRWGKKKDYDFRISTPERALKGGCRGIGLGALLGLGEPRTDLLYLASHLQFLYKKHWDVHYSISFPRLRPEVGGYRTSHAVSDREQVKYIFAFRILFPKFHLVLSTRESSTMRDNLAGVGISKMSVGSKTTVGGYSKHESGSCQFQIADERPREAFCSALAQKGLMGIYKNWDSSLL